MRNARYPWYKTATPFIKFTYFHFIRFPHALLDLTIKVPKNSQ